VIVLRREKAGKAFNEGLFSLGNLPIGGKQETGFLYFSFCPVQNIELKNDFITAVRRLLGQIVNTGLIFLVLTESLFLIFLFRR
jgi:hypothetical protein